MDDILIQNIYLFIKILYFELICAIIIIIKYTINKKYEYLYIIERI